MKNSCTIFWKRYPALALGSSLFLGALLAFEGSWLLLPFLALFLFLDKKLQLLSFHIFLFALIFCTLFYQFPKEAAVGAGYFTITSCTPIGKRGYLYKGTLRNFKENGTRVAAHIPCKIFSFHPYEADAVYQIEGTLVVKKRGKMVSLESKKSWLPLKKHHNLHKLRSLTKNRVQRFIQEKISHESSAAFLTTLLTGDTQDPIQRHVFGKLGLAHLFAVSGFHFVLVALFFRTLLRPFFSRTVEACFLLLLLTLFFLFIGASPSVERAWAVAIFASFALLLSKEGWSLNTFGVSLLVVLSTNPYYAKELSFQLSFLATLGILLFYPLMEALLKPLFPTQSRKEVSKKKWPEKILLLISTFLCKGLALNGAVHLALLPVLLFVFHSFPLHSLIYNLFFPFLVSIALFLFLFSIPFCWIPGFSTGLFQLTTWYTQAILEITEFPPFPHKTLYVEHFSQAALTVLLTLLIFMGIVARHYLEIKKGGKDLHFKWII